jgi:hypothetical protein
VVWAVRGTDLAPLRELRLKLDPWLECTEALGPLIAPNLHSCGTGSYAVIRTATCRVKGQAAKYSYRTPVPCTNS